MSSRIIRDDVEDAAWKAGVRDPRKMDALLRVVDAYAWSLNRTIPDLPLAPAPGDSARTGRSLYLCKSCGDRLPIDMFPEARKADPHHPYDCISCGGTDRKTYRCPGCDQDKVLSEYPESKRANSRIRAFCSWCQPRMITTRDARP